MIKLEHLSKKFGTFTAVNALNLSIATDFRKTIQTKTNISTTTLNPKESLAGVQSNGLLNAKFPRKCATGVPIQKIYLLKQPLD